MPKNKINWTYYLSALIVLGLAIYWLINSLMQKTNSTLKNNTALALPDACSSFELTLGNWFNATIILLGEVHTPVKGGYISNILSVACIRALMHSRSTFNSNYFYYEGLKPNLDICSNADHCYSWENADSWNKVTTLISIRNEINSVFGIYTIVKRTPDKEIMAKLQELLNRNLDEYHPHYINLLISKAFINETLLSEYNQKLAALKKSGDKKDSKRNLLLPIVENFLQQGKKQISPLCDDAPYEKLAECCNNHAIGKDSALNKDRNQALLKKIRENKERKSAAFFLAGRNHVNSVAPELKDSNNIAILQIKK